MDCTRGRAPEAVSAVRRLFIHALCAPLQSSQSRHCCSVIDSIKPLESINPAFPARGGVRIQSSLFHGRDYGTQEWAKRKEGHSMLAHRTARSHQGVSLTQPSGSRKGETRVPGCSRYGRLCFCPKSPPGGTARGTGASCSLRRAAAGRARGPGACTRALRTLPLRISSRTGRTAFVGWGGKRVRWLGRRDSEGNITSG